MSNGGGSGNRLKRVSKKVFDKAYYKLQGIITDTPEYVELRAGVWIVWAKSDAEIVGTKSSEVAMYEDDKSGAVEYWVNVVHI